MKNRIFIILISCLGACRPIPDEVSESLELAGPNEKELKKVLWHYGWHNRDSLKFKAACFLIEHMRWHYSLKQIVKIDPQFESFCRVADSAYRAVWLEMGGQVDSLNRCERVLKKRLKWAD